MSRKISSVHVEMSADSAKLEAGLKKAKGGLEDLKGKAQGVAKPVNDIKSILTNYAAPIGAATAAFGALAYAAKQAFDAGKMGADLLYMQGKFDNLSASIGTTSEVLTQDLRAATKGLVSDAKLVQSAGDFMALGLAKSHDEVVRLTRVAGALGMDMNQLVLTLTNQTTARFDALGVSVDGFDAKVKKLKDSGMDANKAFTEAFLQQAEDQIAKVGDVALTGAGKIDRMEASVENLKNNLRMGLAPAVIAVSEAINDMITDGAPAKEAVNAQAEAVGSLTGTYEDYIAQLTKVAKSQGYTVRYIDGTLRILNSSGMEVSGTFDEMTRTSYTLEKSLISSSFAAAEQAAIMGGDLTPAASEAAKSVIEVARAEWTAYRNATDWVSGMRESVGLLDRLNTMDLNFGDNIKNQLDKMKWDELGGDVIQQAADRINEAMALGVEKGGISEAEGRAALEGLFAASEALEAEITGADFNEVAQTIADDLQIPLDVAKEKAEAAIAAIKAGSLEQYIYDVFVRFTLGGGPTGGHVGQGNVIPAGTVSPKGPPKAAGGSVYAGVSYPVGERGVEMFTPSTNGYITPNHALGGGDVYNNITINALPGQDENAIAAKVFAMLSRGNRRGAAGFGLAGV